MMEELPWGKWQLQQKEGKPDRVGIPFPQADTILTGTRNQTHSRVTGIQKIDKYFLSDVSNNVVNLSYEFEYYPFGMTMRSYDYSSVDNKS